MEESTLKALDRKALQKLAKTNGIKANLKSSEIIKQLIAKQPSKPSRSARPIVSPPKVRRRSTAKGQPQPNVSATSQPPDNEDDAEPVQGVPSSPIPRAQTPLSQPSPAPPASAAQCPLPSTTKSRGSAAARAQLKTSKPKLFHPRDDEDSSEYARSVSSESPTNGRRPGPSRVPRGQASPPQPSSPSPLPVRSRRQLSSFQPRAPYQPEAGPSRIKSKALTLGVFNESSASRAPWPQESRDVARRAPSPSSPSSPPGSLRAIPSVPIFPPGAHPDNISTGNPKQAVVPSYHRSMAQAAGHAGTSASASAPASVSASASRGGPIVPVPGYRSRSPTPLEEYDSLRGVPLFPMPDSDYEESWTPYSPQGQPSHGYMPPAAVEAGPGAQRPDETSPVFRLSRAVFSPPEADYSPPSRSPVFSRPSPPFRPTNPVGRDEYSPDVEPQQHPAGVSRREERAAAGAEAGDELPDYEDYEDEEEEESEDEGQQPATDAELHGMVVRLAILARHQSAAQTGLDDMTEEADRLHRAAPRIRAQLRQERAGFERMHAYLKHLNPRIKPLWDHKAIWDKACLLREQDGNQMEVETSDEEEEAWRKENPAPRGAPATQIEMMPFTPWFPGACEEVDRENVRDVGAAMAKARAELRAVDAVRARAGGAKLVRRQEAPRTPKRRRNVDDDDTNDDSDDNGVRAKKKVRGSAGRTPPPQAFFGKGKGKQRADVETLPLLGIAEEDSGEEEEDMEMTSVV